jgi:pimeloyl-ACP methyl ester carboxylesterase
MIMFSNIDRRRVMVGAGVLAAAPLAGAANFAPPRRRSSARRRRTFVLVHGGGHGGWCWERVAEPLRAAGHLDNAPSLTGLADRSHLLSSSIYLDTQIADIVNLLNWEDLRDVILVGHSYGGMVITGVADRAGDRIGHMVYYDAAHPKNGTALWPSPAGGTRAVIESAPASDSAGRARPQGNNPQASRMVNGVELLMFPDVHLINGALGVTNPRDVAWLMAKLTPHPAKCFHQPLKLDNEAAVHALPTTDIWRMMILDRQQPGMTWAQRLWSINSPSHDLMVTNPAESVALLEKVAKI